jgi:tRNA threonylcarbamoyladenosine biosynthesis protein TsaE
MSISQLCYRVADEEQTRRLAAALASVLPAQALLGLCGPLGAGKTRFVQALAEAVGVDPTEVTSPTFVLCHSYRGSRQVLYHVDVYRIRSEDEWWDLGVQEWLDEQAWVIVEWAERVERLFPDSYLMVHLEIVGTTERLVRFVAHGSPMQCVLERLMERVPGDIPSGS